LQRKIQIVRTKENTMNPRTARFWLPSLVTLMVSMLLLPLLERLGIKPQFLSLRHPGSDHGTYLFTMYTVWLMMLPLVGALGAYLSKRAGGTRQAMMLSALFPAMVFFAVLLVVIAFGTFLEHGLQAGAGDLFDDFISEPFGRLGVLVCWGLVPGVFLLMGVLGFEASATRRVKPAS
jgi:hypothetical protein